MKAIELGSLTGWPGRGPHPHAQPLAVVPDPASPQPDAAWRRTPHRDHISNRSQRGSRHWKWLWPILLGSCCSASLLPILDSWLLGCSHQSRGGLLFPEGSNCLSLSLASLLESLVPQAPRSSSLTWLQKWAQHPRNSGFHVGANSHTTSVQKPSLSAACFFLVSLNYSSQDA